MNICYINPTNNIRRPIAELANILAEEGHNITIMFPHSKQCPTKNWVANETIKNGKIKLVPIKSFYFAPLRYNFPHITDLIKKTKQIYKENDKVHIWEYFYPLSIIPLLYASSNKRRKQKTILTTDGFVGYSYKPKKPWWLVPAFKLYTQLFARFLFKIPKQITTYGKSMIPYAKKAGVPTSKLKVISTGIHLERFQNINSKKIQELKKEFNINDEKVILFVGMLTERKGVDKVIKISQQLLQENYNIKTLIVGDSHGPNVYKKLVRSEYKNRIIFVGGRTEIPEFMKLSTLLLLPSEGEGLPGVVMEAMASGLPVVATREGCTPDLIEDEEDGFLTKDNYFNAARKIIQNTNLKKKFSENSIRKIKQFSWKEIKSKYEILYKK
mgnify:CR=1 FL=1